MSTFLQWSAVVVTLASSVWGSPLSTPHDIPSQRATLALAPLMVSEHPHGSINNSYIVMMKDDAAHLLANHLNFLQVVHAQSPLQGEHSGIKYVYDGVTHGYAGYFSEQVVDRIRQRPEVAYVERDQIVRTMEVQTSAPWGLARISHRPKLTFSTFTKYLYQVEGGDGVDVYVVDTGINIDHVEFEGRASWGATLPQDDVDDDGNGHGSHCAGTIASRKYGVAKKANVVAVKVLGSNGSGSMSDVVGGVVWAAKAAKDKLDAAKVEFAATGKTSHKGSVANMSLGGGKSKALDDAVDRAVDSGLHFAVAAGNDNRDACNYSPAGAEKAVTVGASTLGDERAYFSNHGSCVDVFAPGLNILSTYKGSKSATATLSGTSMASPHVAGLLAYLVSLYPSPQFNPDVSEDLLPLILNQRPMSTSLLAVAQAILPDWAAGFVSRFTESVAPIPPKGPKTLTPAQLKRALLQLSTPDILASLPPNTINLLIYNNATSS